MSDHTYGQGTVFEKTGSPFWYASYYAGGKNHQASTKIRRADDPGQKAARRWLHKKQVAVEAGREVPSAARISFEDMMAAIVANYEVNGRKSLRTVKAVSAHLQRWFGNDRAVAINATRIEAYTAARLREGAKPASVNYELAVLRRMFSLMVRAERLPSAPHISLLAVDNARQGFCDWPDFLHLVEALPEHLRDPIMFLYLSAWRPKEMKTLEWRDVDLAASAIVLRSENSKNRHARLLKLDGRLLDIVQKAREKRRLDCPYVFHHDGRRLVDFQKAWATACTEAGLGGLLVYDLRRSGVRTMVRAGVPERVAMARSGHRTRSIFDRYNIVSEGDQAEAAVAIDKYLDGKEAEPSKVTSLRKTA